MSSNKLIKTIGISVAVIIIIGYSLYQTKDISKGPVLVINYPNDGATLSEQKVIIKGNVKNASYVTLNDRQIFVNENGEFNEILLLSNGYNIVEIKVIDRFERIKTETLELIYSPPK